ncbi:MAG: class I SAM-dependent methyltransferase [Bacteroidia bacterium]
MHSPFVFQLYTEVIRGKGQNDSIEALRKQLMRSEAIVEITDFGAGKAGSGSGTIRRSLKEIARTSARRPFEGNLLYRLCHHFQPQTCLELGTNLGISSLYQLSALKNSRFITLEGSPNLAEIAGKNIADAGFRAEIHTGEFSELLSRLNLDEIQPDYVFLDGNHRYAPTMEYISTILPHMAPGGMIILDDIYWSSEMKKAWETICAMPEITVSIDLFVMGICFVKRPQAKEHFRLRFW